MSLIPNYILKRMIPADGVRNTESGWAISITNAISPFHVDAIPDNFNELFNVSVDGVDLDKNNISLSFEGKEATVENPQEAVGVTVPVGGVIEFRYRGENLEPGKHLFKLLIAARNEISIEFERDVQ
ncbi:MAG TPA: hypothetical protein VKM55_04535 [Candidatus Lokiarchaeia archaeon]|nr:hypothetical protein [Candidatus Lokiarchaeia archaeon]